MKIWFICFLVGLEIADVLSRRCVVYKGSVSAIPKGARYGRTCHYVSNGLEFCMLWDCPPIDCSDPIIPGTGCPYCKGTCIRDGIVHKVNAHFQCGCNSCTCKRSTRRRCHYSLPKECI